jgi:hypothetical protein
MVMWLFDRHKYYLAHRSEILARAKVRREANLELYRECSREAQRRWRELNLELNRKRQIKYFRNWRDSHYNMHCAIKIARNTVPLGSCCEFCGSKDDLMRLLPDYDYPKVVVTVCRDCRGWIRCHPVS